MLERLRYIVLAVTTLAILLLVNSQIVIKERILSEGDTLLLRLAPRDPRSLLQGDYMALRYAMADEVAQAANAAGIEDGRIVVVVEPTGKADYVGLYQGETLERNQHLLRFRKRGDSVRLASDAYFFQEGEWQTYRNAQYGELRVDASGDAVLAGLRDSAFNRLGE
jgi:uncharacterized membrane-anchored protein